MTVSKKTLEDLKTAILNIIVTAIDQNAEDQKQALLDPPKEGTEEYISILRRNQWIVRVGVLTQQYSQVEDLSLLQPGQVVTLQMSCIALGEEAKQLGIQIKS